MSVIRTITFRDQTTGQINDLLIDEGSPCSHSQNLLAYFAGVLRDYKDEGVDFNPTLVLCGSIETFLRAFPGAIHHKIGGLPLHPSSGARILKDCAPLSGKNWSIYIERVSDSEINYGVFTYFRRPTAITLHEGVTLDQTQLCILVRRVSPNTIEMRGAKGSVLTLIFSTEREANSSGTSIEAFANACCSEIGDIDLRFQLSTFFSRLLHDALAACHGTILVCGNNVELKKVPEMQDAVMVSPPLDFGSAFKDYIQLETADSILALQRSEELFKGFMHCDGMVVVDCFCRVIAYRVFYRPSPRASELRSDVVGGARRRAFEGVKKLVGNEIHSALFRSQDGQTIFQGSQQ